MNRTSRDIIKIADESPSQVRQFNETSADDGKTWTANYDFTYIRKK